MDSTILTELFGVAEGYELERAEQQEDCLRLHLRVHADRFRCPTCGSAAVSRKGRRHRVLQTVPVGLTPVYLHTEVPDCACRDCGLRFELSLLLPRPIAGHHSPGGVRANPRAGDVFERRGRVHGVGLGHGQGPGQRRLTFACPAVN